MLPARLPAARVPSTYAWIAPVHDLLAFLVARAPRALLLRWAAVEDGERVLEVGVGTGLTFEQVLRATPAGYAEGADVSPAMLRHARRRASRTGHPHYRLRRADARALGVAPASFDVLLCSYVLDLLPEADFAPVLAGFWQALRPGGRLVLANMTRSHRPSEAFWQLLYHLPPICLGGCRSIEAAAAVRAAGFTALRRAVVVRCGFPTEVLYAERPLASLP